LAPEYAKAAQRIAAGNPPYYFAKVDAEKNPIAIEKYGVKGFPTVILFR
jgi:hypothetical protein